VDLDRGLIRRVPNKTAKSGKPVLIGIPAALLAKLSETPTDRRKGYVLPKYAELYTYRNADGRPSKQAMISIEIQAHFKACGIETHRAGTGYKTEPDPNKPGKTIEVYTGRRAVLDVGFHSLRHTYVSMHAQAGTPQAMIQANVGHSNPAMTAHYTHVNEESARTAAGVLTLTAPAEHQARPPLPDWAREVAEKMTAKNWKQAQKKLLEKKNFRQVPG
jgi:integrase